MWIIWWIILCIYIYMYILVGGAITILKDMSSSMGRMKSHIWNVFKKKNTNLARNLGCSIPAFHIRDLPKNFAKWNGKSSEIWGNSSHSYTFKRCASRFNMFKMKASEKWWLFPVKYIQWILGVSGHAQKYFIRKGVVFQKAAACWVGIKPGKNHGKIKALVGFLPSSYAGWWFFAYPSEKWWSSSLGMIIPFPTEWEHQIHVPNHQPDLDPTTYPSLGMHSPSDFKVWIEPRTHLFFCASHSRQLVLGFHLELSPWKNGRSPGSEQMEVR